MECRETQYKIDRYLQGELTDGVAQATGLDYLSYSPPGSINMAHLNMIYRPENRE
ncbi:MAG: hypothetical protein V5A84_05110 [Planctomycetota bacterium]